MLFANEITVEVFGDNFLPAYTRGDNSSVVATDSMKNFILSQAREYEGATLEGTSPASAAASWSATSRCTMSV